MNDAEHKIVTNCGFYYWRRCIECFFSLSRFSFFFNYSGNGSIDHLMPNIRYMFVFATCDRDQSGNMTFTIGIDFQLYFEFEYTEEKFSFWATSMQAFRYRQWNVIRKDRKICQKCFPVFLYSDTWEKKFCTHTYRNKIPWIRSQYVSKIHKSID